MKTRCIQSYKFKLVLDFFLSLANIVIIQHVDFYGCQMVELLEKYARLWGCLLLDVWNTCSGHVTGTVQRNFMKFPSRSRHRSLCSSQFPCFSLVGIADIILSSAVLSTRRLGVALWSCPVHPSTICFNPQRPNLSIGCHNLHLFGWTWAWREAHGSIQSDLVMREANPSHVSEVAGLLC